MSERPLNPYIYVRVHGRHALFTPATTAEAMTRANTHPEHVPTLMQRFIDWLMNI
jgi:hypothetical protein